MDNCCLLHFGKRSDCVEEEHGEELRTEPLLRTAAYHRRLGQSDNPERRMDGIDTPVWDGTQNKNDLVTLKQLRHMNYTQTVNVPDKSHHTKLYCCSSLYIIQNFCLSLNGSHHYMYAIVCWIQIQNYSDPGHVPFSVSRVCREVIADAHDS